MVFRLSDDVVFPDPTLADDDGLLAVGGALTPEWLITAYSYGIFPWSSFREDELLWFCPHERFVIFPREIHISHSMRQLLRRGQYKATLNKDFEGVIRGCSMAQGRYDMEGAWLGEDMIAAFLKMHELGVAASVEVWDGDKLVGGLYGMNIGWNFFGESMFSLVPNASKIALIFLAELMADSDGIIDCQLETPHLRSMGGRYISYDEYMRYLEKN